MIAEIEKGRKVTPPRLHRVNPDHAKHHFFSLTCWQIWPRIMPRLQDVRLDVGPCLWSPVSWQVIPVEIRMGRSGRRVGPSHLSAFYVVREKGKQILQITALVFPQGGKLCWWEGSVGDSDTGLKASVHKQSLAWCSRKWFITHHPAPSAL